MFSGATTHTVPESSLLLATAIRTPEYSSTATSTPTRYTLWSSITGLNSRSLLLITYPTLIGYTTEGLSSSVLPNGWSTFTATNSSLTVPPPGTNTIDIKYYSYNYLTTYNDKCNLPLILYIILHLLQVFYNKGDIILNIHTPSLNGLITSLA